MEPSVNLNHFFDRPGGEPERGFDDVLEKLTAAGFRVFDYPGVIEGENWLSGTKRQREMFDKSGARVGQSHAPFNRYRTYPDSEFPEIFHRAFEAAAILGSKYVVVHADEYRSIERYDEKEIVEFTYDYLAPEFEFAKKRGMKLAIENLFEDLPSDCKYFDGKSRFTSRAEEVIAIIERFNDPDVVCCYDTGHGAVSCHKASADALKKLAKYVGCTHIHDNYLYSDAHMLPFTGKLDWPEHTRILREAGYKGDITLELVYDRMPDALVSEWMKLCYDAAERLVEMTQG